MSRRGNGEGTICKRSDGRWVAAVSYPDGPRKWIYGATRAEVDAKLTAAKRARDQGLPASEERRTLGAFLIEWLEASRSTLRARTWVRYEELVRLHIIPELGHVALARLGPEQLQRLYAAKLAGGLSPTTVHHVHAVVHRALSQAERWGRVPRNVASLVDGPRVARREMATLTEEQLRRLDDAIAGDELEGLFVVAFTTGMRLSEILGLRWRDVDLDRAEIQLRSTLEWSGDEFGFSEPKTRGSRRHILLTAHAIASLRRHRVRQAAARLAAGAAWGDYDLVFTNVVGQPVAESTLRLVYRAALKRAGLPRIRFHDLRHTAATIALGRGVHPKVVSEMLGHSRIAVTLDLYSHVTPTMQREAVAAMDAAMGGER